MLGFMWYIAISPSIVTTGAIWAPQLHVHYAKQTECCLIYSSRINFFFDIFHKLN